MKTAVIIACVILAALEFLLFRLLKRVLNKYKDERTTAVEKLINIITKAMGAVPLLIFIGLVALHASGKI